MMRDFCMIRVSFVLQNRYHTGKWFRVGYEFTDLAMSL